MTNDELIERLEAIRDFAEIYAYPNIANDTEVLIKEIKRRIEDLNLHK